MERWSAQVAEAFHGVQNVEGLDFVLPPSMAASGRVRPPPGWKLRLLRQLEQQSTDVRHPQLERVRSPQRTNEDKLSDDDTREHKRQTVALTSALQKLTIGAIFATTVDGEK